VISRRNFIAAATASIFSVAVRATGSAENTPAVAPLDFSVPQGACDCQTHVFGNPLKFPFSPDRSYTPQVASIGEMLALHRALHVDRVVVVQPTVYGTDNACMLDALRQLGTRARGVAAIGEEARPNLDAMERQGVRGLRIGLEGTRKLDPALALRTLRTAVQQIADHAWHIQIGARLPVIETLRSELSEVPVPIVFEHFAHAEAPLGLDQPGFRPLLDLVGSGKAYVKVSAAYRCCSIATDSHLAQEQALLEVAPFAKALVSANPERVIWGSDWPHSAGTPTGHSVKDTASRMVVDDGSMLNLLATWAPDPEVRRKILVENPARLYGF
jgi:predicted TIM-barrel fold metal-dependent hydrolase